MNAWLRRLLIILFLLVWLVIVLFPGFAFYLAANGQVELGKDPLRHMRIFLISEADVAGVGIERARPVGDPAGCAETSITYLMWRGEGESARFCQCYNEQGGIIFTSTAACSTISE
jgi:hypothetical protein